MWDQHANSRERSTWVISMEHTTRRPSHTHTQTHIHTHTLTSPHSSSSPSFTALPTFRHHPPPGTTSSWEALTSRLSSCHSRPTRKGEGTTIPIRPGTYTRAHTRTHAHTHTHTRAHAHTHTHTRARTHAHTRAKPHTHAHSQPQPASHQQKVLKSGQILPMARPRARQRQPSWPTGVQGRPGDTRSTPSAILGFITHLGGAGHSVFSPFVQTRNWASFLEVQISLTI